MADSYTFQKAPDGSFSFTAKDGTVYSAYFLDGSGYFPANPEYEGRAVMFGFQPESAVAEADERIAPSVCSIIAQYLSDQPEKFLLAVFDQRDSRQQARNRLFQNWFKHNTVAGIAMKSYSIGDDASGTFFCIIYHVGLPDEAPVLLAIDKMIQAILDKPTVDRDLTT